MGDAGGEGSELAEGIAIARFHKRGQPIHFLGIAIVGPIDDGVDDLGGPIGRGAFPAEAVPFAHEDAIRQHFFDGILRIDRRENPRLERVEFRPRLAWDQELFASHSMMEIVHA